MFLNDVFLQIFCPLFIGLFVTLLWIDRTLYILNTNPLSDHMYCFYLPWAYEGFLRWFFKNFYTFSFRDNVYIRYERGVEVHHCSTRISNVVSALNVKYTTPSTLNYSPCQLTEIQLNIFVALYLHFLFCSVDPKVYPCANTTALITVTLRQSKSSHLFLLRSVLAILHPAHFHINFIISLSMSLT